MYSGYGNYGCAQPVGNNFGGYGYALILVLFILLVIIGSTSLGNRF